MPISLKLKEIFKKYFRAMFIYMVVSYNQNFSQIKKIFQKHQKKTKKNLLYFFWTKFYIWLKFRLYLTNIYINIILKFFLNISFFVEGGGGFFQNVNLYKKLRAGQCQNSMVLRQNEENQTFRTPFLFYIF